MTDTNQQAASAMQKDIDRWLDRQMDYYISKQAGRQLLVS